LWWPVRGIFSGRCTSSSGYSGAKYQENDNGRIVILLDFLLDASACDVVKGSVSGLQIALMDFGFPMCRSIHGSWASKPERFRRRNVIGVRRVFFSLRSLHFRHDFCEEEK